MSEIRKIAHNTLIQLIGKVITVALGLLAFSLIARSLGQAGFGQFTTIYAFLAVFGILIDWGLQMTVTQLISDPREDQNKILSNALTLRLLGSVIFLGLAPLLVLLFPYSLEVKIGVAIAVVGFIFNSMMPTLISLFQKNLAMRQVVTADVLAKLIYIGLIIFAFYLNIGLLGFVGATAIDGLITFAILFHFAKKHVIIKPRFDKDVWYKIFIKTWPIALTIALNLLYFKGDLVIMSLLRSQAEVGLYGAPYRVLEVLINVVYLFLGLILPLMAAAVAIKNFQRLKNILQAVFDFLIIIGLPLIVGGYFLGRPVMLLLAGDQFAISGEIIKILFIATTTIFIAALFGYAIVALNKQKQMIKFYAVNALISVTAYLILIPKYSYWAAAWITVASEIFIMLTAIYVIYKTIKFIPRLTIIVKSLIASLIMALPLFFLDQLNFIILILIGASVYFVILYLLKGFDKQTILEVVKIKNQ